LDQTETPQGPFSAEDIAAWYADGHFPRNLRVRPAFGPGASDACLALFELLPRWQTGDFAWPGAGVAMDAQSEREMHQVLQERQQRRQQRRGPREAVPQPVPASAPAPPTAAPVRAPRRYAPPMQAAPLDSSPSVLPPYIPPPSAALPLPLPLPLPLSTPAQPAASLPGLECTVCHDAPRNAFFVPCGHIVACMTCFEVIMAQPEAHKRTCPMCRSPLERCYPAFLS
jgi:hypothetical protein